jgi:hypothetical protein
VRNNIKIDLEYVGRICVVWDYVERCQHSNEASDFIKPVGQLRDYFLVRSECVRFLY